MRLQQSHNTTIHGLVKLTMATPATTLSLKLTATVTDPIALINEQKPHAAIPRRHQCHHSVVKNS
ncbi:MAG: hypothetical protein COB33_015390 [Thiotrichaceae bacterium]|nr:hypothetical protein [Thiotrichaceae bacterium]